MTERSPVQIVSNLPLAEIPEVNAPLQYHVMGENIETSESAFAVRCGDFRADAMPLGFVANTSSRLPRSLKVGITRTSLWCRANHGGYNSVSRHSVPVVVPAPWAQIRLIMSFWFPNVSQEFPKDTVICVKWKRLIDVFP